MIETLKSQWDCKLSVLVEKKLFFLIMAATGENVIPPDENINNGNNELLLYSYHHCFYTQKVLMALYEKNIPFTSKTIDITKGEQYQIWYLKINSRGEVPVLKDGIKYIPDSERIIDYLEDNFSNGGHYRLIPIDQGQEVKQKVIKFHSDINSIPVNIITLGSLFNDEFCSNLRYPFVIPSVRKNLKASEVKGGENLRELAINYPEFRETFLQKAVDQDKRKASVTDKEEFSKVLQRVEQLLDKVEEELSSHTENKSDWWLCTDRFTMADIALTILLDRLSRVGLENYFWAKGKRANIDNYYRRAQRRESYKKTMPTLITDISIIIKAKAPLILGVSLLTVLTVVVGGFFYFKK